MAKRKQLTAKRHKGLFVYCHVCKKHFTWTKRYTYEKGKQIKEEPICGKTKKNYSSCPNFSVHRYKSRVNIPGTNGSKKETKVHEVTTYNDAVSEAIKFEKEVKEKNRSKFDKNSLEDQQHLKLTKQKLELEQMQQQLTLQLQ